jgi:translation initiation factor 4G
LQLEGERRVAQEKADALAAKEKAQEEEKTKQQAAQAEKQLADEAEQKKAREQEDARQADVDAAKESSVRAESDSEIKIRNTASLPAKPSAEVLESVRASPAPSALAPPSDGRTSNAPSPVASPSLSHATLPAKPAALSTSALARKGAPSALSLPPSEDGSSSAQQSSASAQALLTARPIEKLEEIRYPEGLQSPNNALNTGAQPGKFRYDRDFLLQFMSVCRDKPESLPPLDQLGMERDHGSMGRGGSSRGGQRSGSQMGNPRGANMGIGGIGGGMGSFGGKPPGGMGSFGMGTFNRPAATSEERMAASRMGNMGNAFGSARNTPGMARTPSQSGPGGLNMMAPGMGRERSQAGSARGKRRGEPRGAPTAMASGQFEPDVAPLELSANRWTPGVQSRRPGAVDESSPEYVERKVKGLLNKLTKEKFNSISNQILEWGNKSISENDGQTLRLVIKLIFEKAKDEQFWSSMYAELCHKLLETLSPEIKDEQVVSADGTPLAGGVLFRKYLLNRCQEDFERGWKNKEDASAAAKTKASEDEKNKAAHAEAVAAGKEVEEFKFSDEYYAEQAAKRQGLGLVKFVGELYKLDMLSLKIMNACIVKLLHNIVTPDEEDVESLCQLISTVGEKIQKTSPSAAGTLGIFISRMTEMKSSPHISSRMKFMLLVSLLFSDVIDLALSLNAPHLIGGHRVLREWLEITSRPGSKWTYDDR